MSILLDTHYHLDYIPNLADQALLLKGAEENKLGIVAQTVLPSEFRDLIEVYGPGASASADKPILSLGFHPWWIESEEQVARELDIFKEMLKYTPYIGEIGLDFSPKRLAKASQDLQERVLRQILEILVESLESSVRGKSYVLSIHAVSSVSSVLDILASYEEIGQQIIPILHRFAGNSDELTRNIRLGGYISVHPKMLTTKRGRAYVQQIPGERLLLESDLPGETVEKGQTEDSQVYLEDLKQSLHSTLDHLSQLRQEDIRPVIVSNQARLYDI